MKSNEILELLNQFDENSANVLEKDAKELIKFYYQQTLNIEKMEDETHKMKEEIEEITNLHPDIDPSDFAPDFTQLYELHHEKDNQEQEIENIQKYCGEIKTTIQQRETDLENIRSKHQKILFDISEKESTNKNLKQSLANANASYDEANQRLSLQKKEIENKDSKISKLKNDIEERKRMIEDEENHLRLYSSFNRKKSIELKKLDHMSIIGIEFSSLLDDSYDPDAFYLAGTGRYLSKWSFSSAKEIAKADLFAEPIAFHIEPESGLISVSCSDDNTYIYDSSSLQNRVTLRSHQRNLTDNCWITRNQLLTVSKERTIQLYDVDQSRLLHTMMIDNPIRTISSLGNTYCFMVASESGGIKIVDIRQEKEVNSLTNFNDSRRVQINTLLPNSLYEKIYALEYKSNCIYEIDVSSLKIVNKLTHSSISHDNKFSCMTIDPFSHFLAAGTTNGSVVIFDISNDISVDNNDDDDDDKVNVLKKKHDKIVTCSKLGPNKLLTADSHDLYFWE